MQLYGDPPIHSHSFAPGEEAATKDFPATIQIIVGAEFAPPVIDKLISLGCVIHGDHKDLERHTETMPAMFGGGRFWGADVAFYTWDAYDAWWHWMEETVCTDSSFPVVVMERQYRSAAPKGYETPVATIVRPHPSPKKMTPPVRDTDRLEKWTKDLGELCRSQLTGPGMARRVLGSAFLADKPQSQTMAEGIERNVRDDGAFRLVPEAKMPDRSEIVARVYNPPQQMELATLHFTKPDPLSDEYRRIEREYVDKMRRRDEIGRHIKITPDAFKAEMPGREPHMVTTVDVELPDDFTQEEAEWAIKLTAGMFPWPKHLTRLQCSRLDGSVERVIELIEQPGVIAIHMYRPVIRRQDEGYVYDHTNAYTMVRVKDAVNETDSKRLLDMARQAFRGAVTLEEERFNPGLPGLANITLTVTGLPDQHRRLHKE